MKVRFLKNHLWHKKGEVSDIVDAQANYYIKCGVASEVVKKAEEQTPFMTPKTTAPKKRKGK